MEQVFFKWLATQTSSAVIIISLFGFGLYQLVVKIGKLSDTNKKTNDILVILQKMREQLHELVKQADEIKQKEKLQELVNAHLKQKGEQ